MDTPKTRSLIQPAIRLAILVAILTGCVSLAASPAMAQGLGSFAVGGNYNYVHSNGPPGGCGCFSLNGGSGWVSIGLPLHLAAVGDFGVQHASDINGSGIDLTLTSYTFGLRYNIGGFERVHPFAEALVGGAHASGSFAATNVTVSGTSNSFAALAGGGLDVDLGSHFGMRLIEADYYSTQFPNGVNDHQNNYRIAAGIYFRFGAH